MPSLSSDECESSLPELDLTETTRCLPFCWELAVGFFVRFGVPSSSEPDESESESEESMMVCLPLRLLAVGFFFGIRHLSKHAPPIVSVVYSTVPRMYLP